jgi:hypothetical protein
VEAKYVKLNDMISDLILKNKLHDALSFTEEVVSKNLSIEKDSFCEMIDFSNEFNEIYDRVTPYHIFLLDLIRSGEREIDHSRMLQKLLFFCSKEKEYPILKSFFKKLNLNLTIKNPQITAESKRIDILILDGKDYAIIIENKINGALDQPNQLANYINKMLDAGYASKHIYVIYIPKEDGKEPVPQSWTCNNKSYYDEFEGRFKIISKNELLQWLENDVSRLELTENDRNRYLQSTIEQYIYILKTI